MLWETFFKLAHDFVIEMHYLVIITGFDILHSYDL